MRKITSIIAVICLVALCFTLFVACAGNPNKVDDYVAKLNEVNDFYVITEVSKGEEKITSEVVVSINKIQVLHSGFIDVYNPAPVIEVTEKDIDDNILKDESREDAKKRIADERLAKAAFVDNDIYYEIVSDTEAYEYNKFRCWSHTKPAVDKSKNDNGEVVKTPNGVFEPDLGDKYPVDKNGNAIPENKWMVEWKKSKIDTDANYLTQTRAHYRDLVAKFNLSADNLVWNKEAKAFVYADGKAPSDASISNVKVTAAKGVLNIVYEQNGMSYNMSLMNFGTARVSIPVLCPIFAK